MTKLATLQGLVFVIDWDDIAHDVDRFTDEVFALGFVKEVGGPYINGAIAITVDVDAAIDKLKLRYLMIPKITERIDAVAAKIYKRHKGKSAVTGKPLLTTMEDPNGGSDKETILNREWREFFYSDKR